MRYLVSQSIEKAFFFFIGHENQYFSKTYHSCSPINSVVDKGEEQVEITTQISIAVSFLL